MEANVTWIGGIGSKTALGLVRVVAACAALAAAGTADAAEIRVLSAGAFKAVVVAFQPEFELASGHRLTIASDTVGGLARRIAAGEAFDVMVATPALVDTLTETGRVAPGTRRDLARVGVGVAVREGEPKPDISTLAAFRAALVAAPSIAYIDPASGGSSGIYLAGLFARLGIADEVARKAVLVPGGYAAERVQRGEAAIALHQISEILPVPGVVLVGPLPPEIQNETVYSAAIGKAAADPAAARDLLAALAGPGAIPVLTEKGMIPARTP